jgi:uncharacterized protein (TIGR02594 family)
MIEVPRWIISALSGLGETEIPGAATNAFIGRCLLSVKQSSDDEIPWCSAYVNYAFVLSGIAGTDNAAARSWLEWGDELKELKFGCVGVFQRGLELWQGHVGFCFGKWGDSIILLGGNQSNMVKFSLYPATTLLGLRWPSEINMKGQIS